MLAISTARAQKPSAGTKIGMGAASRPRWSPWGAEPDISSMVRNPTFLDCAYNRTTDKIYYDK